MGLLAADAVRLLADLRGEAPLIHVVDIGANPLEEPSYKGLLDMGLCRVTGFEPQPEALAELNQTKGPNEIYLPHAVGDGSEAVLHVAEMSGFTSLFPPLAHVARLLGWRRKMAVRETVPLTTRVLDQLDEVGPIDFLKIDVQGAELSIIRNGRAKLAGAVAVQTEVRFLPIYEGEPRFGGLDNELARQGFSLHDFVSLKRVRMASANSSRLSARAVRQIVDGDAIYLRDLARPRRLSDDQLFKAAILAVGVLESASAAVYCLDLLQSRGRVTQDQIDRFLSLLPPRLLRGARP